MCQVDCLRLLEVENELYELYLSVWLVWSMVCELLLGQAYFMANQLDGNKVVSQYVTDFRLNAITSWNASQVPLLRVAIESSWRTTAL